ncbi:MAG: hypothetical protein AAGC77_14895 [Pseudomonadota bacterium]
MSERLKQIWSGFEETTTRELTGKGVDNIIVPQRFDDAQSLEDFLPDDFEGPAHAAFAALSDAVERSTKKSRGLFSGKNPTDGGEPETMATMNAQPMDSLNRGLRVTAMLTERPDMDYVRFMDSEDGKKSLKRFKKKKRFGIF